MKRVGRQTLTNGHELTSWMAAALALPLIASVLWSGAAAAQGSGGAAAPSTEYWGAGASFVGLAADEDDFFWGLDVSGNAVFVAGERGPAQGGAKRMFVAKFLTDGRSSLALDASFGTAGVANLDLSPYQGTADDPATAANETDNAIEASRGVRVQKDGRIVLVGVAEDPADATPDASTPAVLVLARLNPNGSLDESFGVGGRTLLDVGGAGAAGAAADEAPWGLELDAEGRILVSLSAPAPAASGRSDRDRFALRFAANGALDQTWGGAAAAGIVSFDGLEGSDDNQRHGVALPGGGLLSVGYTNLSARNQLILVKLTPEGALDPSFSGDGRVRITPFPLGFAEAYDAVRLSDGSFITTGYGNLYANEAPPPGVPQPGTDAVQFRITADGSFDREFGEHGDLAYNVANGNDRGRSLLALPDDTVVVGGTAIPGGPAPSGQALNPEDAMLFALGPDGRVREDFDRSVHRLFDFGGSDEEFYGLELGRLANESGQPAFLAAAGYSRQGSRPNGDGVLVILPVPPRHLRPATE